MREKTIREVQRGLRDCGWPIGVDGELGPRTREAISDFKRGYAFHRPPMNRNSDQPGFAFRHALRRSVKHGGACSRHYKFSSWKSHGDGWIKVNRVLIRGLEKMTAKFGVVISVMSGYRDPEYNKSIGGATFSQHLYGNACDPFDQHHFSLAEVRSLKVFSGLEVHKDGKVGHVDVRHDGPNNTTNSTVENPSIFFYNN